MDTDTTCNLCHWSHAAFWLTLSTVSEILTHTETYTHSYTHTHSHTSTLSWPFRANDFIGLFAMHLKWKLLSCCVIVRNVLCHSLSLSFSHSISLSLLSVLLSTLALFVVLVAPAVNCLINWQWQWHLLRSRPSGKSESVARVKRGACNCVRVNVYDS